MRRRTHLTRGAAAAAAAVLTSAIAAWAAAQPQPQPRPGADRQASGQGSQAGAPQQPSPAPGPPAAPPKPLVPVAASTLAATPETYYGEPVSLAGALEENLSRTAFSVDQDRTKRTGKDVLVVAPNLQRQIDPDTYVTVIGEAMRFDPAALGAKLKGYTLDIGPEVAARYAGRPVVIATSVIDNAGNDVARRLPPPMTADEEAYQTLMRQVGSSNAALRKAIEGSDAKLAIENGLVLRRSFDQVESFWKARRRNDAAQWAEDARELSAQIERAAAAGRWADVKTRAGTLGGACQACHAAYRERFDDGSFRIRTPGR